MHLYTPDQVPSVFQGRVCRHSRLMALVGAIVVLGLCAVLPAYIIWQARASLWISIPVMSLASLMVIGFLGMLVKACRSTNWLMRIAPDGLWINLRSYLNRDFAPAATVLFVAYPEIASASRYTVKRSEENHGDRTDWSESYLDIRLVHAAPAEVVAEISAERKRFLPGEYLGGLVTSQSRNNHVPVTMPTERVLRLAWRGRYDFVVPSLKKTLRELSANCAIDEPAVKNLADVKQLTGEEVDRLIIACVETGDTLGAVKLLREKRGMTLLDAKKFVDELTCKL